MKLYPKPDGISLKYPTQVNTQSSSNTITAIKPSPQQVYEIGSYFIAFEWKVGKGYIFNGTKYELYQRHCQYKYGIYVTKCKYV